MPLIGSKLSGRDQEVRKNLLGTCFTCYYGVPTGSTGFNETPRNSMDQTLKRSAIECFLALSPAQASSPSRFSTCMASAELASPRGIHGNAPRTQVAKRRSQSRSKATSKIFPSAPCTSHPLHLPLAARKKRTSIRALATIQSPLEKW